MRFDTVSIASLGFLAFSATSLLSAEVADDMWLECRKSNTCTVEIDHLANLKDSPFLRTGRVVDVNHPKWSRYKRSLRRFSTVQDCIPYGAANETGINLLKFDWSAIRTGPDTEVCLFLISKSLGSLDQIEHWFSYYGFKTKLFIADLDKPETYIPGYRVHAFGAWMDIDDYRRLRPTWIHTLTGFDASHNFAVDVSFDTDMTLTSIHAKTNNK